MVLVFGKKGGKLPGHYLIRQKSASRTRIHPAPRAPETAHKVMHSKPYNIQNTETIKINSKLARTFVISGMRSQELFGYAFDIYSHPRSQSTQKNQRAKTRQKLFFQACNVHKLTSVHVRACVFICARAFKTVRTHSNTHANNAVNGRQTCIVRIGMPLHSAQTKGKHANPFTTIATMRTQIDELTLLLQVRATAIDCIALISLFRWCFLSLHTFDVGCGDHIAKQSPLPHDS